MKGLIHRDIKPSNVIVCERGGQFDVAKLLDFGLVHVAGIQLPSETEAAEGLSAAADLGNTSQLTAAGQVLGTPAYLSPEQARGQQADARSDVYGLGCLAYFLVTGRDPFVSGSVKKLYAAHVTEKPRPLREIRPDVPADVEEAVLRCMEKDPIQRFQTVQGLMAALASCSAAKEWNDAQARKWWTENQAWLAETGALSLAEEPLGRASIPEAEGGSATWTMSSPSADGTTDFGDLHRFSRSSDEGEG